MFRVTFFFLHLTFFTKKKVKSSSTFPVWLQLLQYIEMALSSLFGGSSNSGSVASTPVSSPSQVKDDLKNQISQELAVANVTELVNKITDNCFDQCLNAPYSNANEPCVDRCLEKYMRAWNVVSKTYISRIQQAGK